MSKIFVISDLHLGDETGIQERGFSDVATHDSFIVDSWNSVVSEEDTVWVLGDVTRKSKKPYPLLNLLNGTKNLVLGNNDRPDHIRELIKYFDNICGALRIDNVLLTHIPVISSEIYDGSFNCHGHLHLQVVMNDGTKKPDPRYVNVCCEMVDYLPQDISQWLIKK